MDAGGPPGGPGGRGRAQGVGRAPHLRAQGVSPLWYFLRSVFFINSKNDFREVSGLLEFWLEKEQTLETYSALLQKS